MKKRVGIILTCLSLVLSGLPVNTTTSEAASATFTESHFGEGFDKYDTAVMEKADGWSNGGFFDCTWRPENVAFSDGIMSLKIDKDSDGSGYSGGEYRTRQTFGYGMYSVNMKPIKNPGVVTSFFTYTGPTDGTVWDEIDIEFLGYDTTKVQFNYFTAGEGEHEYLYNLGFDASKEFHTYGFFWADSYIAWYVDGKEVYRATENIPSTPGKIMVNAWPGTGVDDWLKPYDGKTPLNGYYDWISYDAPTGETPDPGKESEKESEKQTEKETEPAVQVNFDGSKVYKILSVNSGKALDVYYGEAENGTNILQYNYEEYPNQKWYVQKQDNGYYIIKNFQTGKVVTVEEFSKENGGNVHQWEYIGNTNQEWVIEESKGHYRLKNRNSGLYLDVADNSKEDNANVHQWQSANEVSQLWDIVLAEEKPNQGGNTGESEPQQTESKPIESEPQQTESKPGESEPQQTESKPGESESEQTGEPESEVTPIETEPQQTEGKPNESEPQQTESKPLETEPQQTESKPLETEPQQTETEPATSLGAVSLAIISNKTEKDAANSVYAELSLRVTKSAKTSNKLKWNRIKGADGYVVFAARCGKPLQIAATIKNGATTSWKHTKLNKGTYYKYVVLAYQQVGEKQLAVSTSKMIHVPAKGGKYSDIKAIKVNKKKVTLKKGGTFKIKATEVKKNSSQKIKRHRKIGYESTNTKVAAVSKNGKIKAKAKGTCYIYLYAQNGVSKKIKVQVKN